MFCPQCGTDAGDAKFCPKCGYNLISDSTMQQGKKEKKKFPIVPVIIVVAIAIAAIVATSQSQNSNDTVAQVFDATRFIVSDGESKRPMTEDELIAEIGQPDSSEDWNFEFNGAQYPVKTLTYHDGGYAYEFNNDQLVRIQILVPATFENKEQIPEMYNLSGGTVITDTPAAYRVENCGVHDLWCTYGEEGTIVSAYISYTNFFENPYDPVMEGDGQRPPDLQVVDYTTTNDGYVSYVTGHIINNSSKTYSYVQVSIGLYKDEVLVGSTLDNVNNLAPGMTWEFKALITSDDANQFKIEDVTGW